MMAKPLLTAIQYEAFNTSPFRPSSQHSPPKLYYRCLQHIISVEFPKGYHNNGFQLDKGTTFVFAFFNQCILTQKDPQLDHLNIHFYSEENGCLQITDISCVHSLVGWIRDGPKSWAILDQGGMCSQETYLTHEAS